MRYFYALAILVTLGLNALMLDQNKRLLKLTQEHGKQTDRAIVVGTEALETAKDWKATYEAAVEGTRLWEQAYNLCNKNLKRQ